MKGVGKPFASQVLHCAPAEVPASLMMERAGDAERAAARFAETRSMVLTTIDLYLGTGRWAGPGVEISNQPRPAREGTEDECRALRAVAAGRTPPSWATPMGAKEAQAVAGVVGVVYQPGQGGRAPQLLVRLAALLCDADGAVLRAAPADVSVDYAAPAPRYQERGSQEIAQEIVERSVPALSAAMR